MKNILIIILIIGVSFTSCKDFIEVENPDIVLAEDNYQSYYDGLVSILGIYESLQRTAETQFLLGELRADLTITNSNAPYYLQEISQSIFSESNPYTGASQFYRIINQVNDVMSNMDRLQDNDPGGVSDEVREKFEAELIYLRASAYLYLVRYFDKVVYFTEPLIKNNQNVILKELTKDQVLDSMIAQVYDMTFVRDVRDIVTPDFSGLWYRSRFTNYPPYQLLGELYLERGMWKQAQEAFYYVMTDVDRNGFWELRPSRYGDGDWSNLFGRLTGNYARETLLIIPFSATDGQTHNLQRWCSDEADGVYYVKPTEVGLSKFAEPIDRYRGAGDSYLVHGNNNIINKYIGNTDPYDNESAFIIWRAGDTYLDFCETLVRQGNYKDALSILNTGEWYQLIDSTEVIVGEDTSYTYNYGDVRIEPDTRGVRGRVSMDPLTIEFPEGFTPTSVDDTLRLVDEMILDERVRELAWEGHRFADLVRSAKWRNDPEFLADKVALKHGRNNSDYDQLYQYLTNMSNWYIPFNIDNLDIDRITEDEEETVE